MDTFYIRLLVRHSMCAMIACTWIVSPAVAATTVDFNRDVLPLLSDRCFHCHGPDKQENDLRLDRREAAVESGAITPGVPNKSDLIERILTDDADERMPPAKSHKPQLSAKEVAVLKKWIEQGANYEKHWAYVAPQKTPLPIVRQKDWPRNTIDRFVLAQIEAKGLAPSPPATKATLLRRVTFDLTGLPPTPEEMDAFVADTSTDAYEKVVERLLASPQYGENMARVWLDAARYADTNGYLQNAYRVSWPWRDWVVRAFQKNKPYDKFLTEILAGDLVPNANEDTKIATAFLRMNMIICEGGSLDEEFRVEYAADRAETVSTVLMGLTMNCCRCHDHKYDPFSQQEYFQMFAMFADPKDEDPVVDHSRSPALPPLINLRQDRFTSEVERLSLAIKTANASGNPHSQKRLEVQQSMLKKGLPLMIMSENPKPRQNYILDRGSYQSPNKKRPVERGAIETVLAWNGKLPRNRLGLAQWLLAADHPLTARVEVNRLWTLFFARGLVVAPENFGVQGGYPTHPQVLDTLAVEFREGGWDRKALIRKIVTSATYKQSSNIPHTHTKLDPENRLLARKSRRRLSAEAIRDQALSVSGLLVEHVGGHPVLPYQPDGLWIEGANTPGHGRGSMIIASIYEQSSGDELYRRSLYTFWNRNAPPPQMVIFDAPNRSFASVGRSTTNTPLQALLTMNDTQHAEAVRFLAERTLLDATLKNTQARVAMIYRRCTGRRIATDDLADLCGALEVWLGHFRADPDRANVLLAKSGKKPSRGDLAAAEHAAWMLLANTIMNLDATLVVD